MVFGYWALGIPSGAIAGLLYETLLAFAQSKWELGMGQMTND
jgi:hypothetical protein